MAKKPPQTEEHQVEPRLAVAHHVPGPTVIKTRKFLIVDMGSDKDLVGPAPVKPPTDLSAWDQLGAFVDSQGRAVAQVERTTTEAIFIERNSGAFRLQTLSITDFNKKYKPLTDPPNFCDHFLAPIKEHGAPADVLKYVARVSKLTDEVLNEASQKQNQKQQAFKERIMAAKEKNAGVKKAMKGQKAAAKAKGEKAPGEKRVTAASMFQDLIMGGNFSDDTIFKKVQEKFGLPDNKRSYVAWYRNHLKKAGQKPPEAKA